MVFLSLGIVFSKKLEHLAVFFLLSGLALALLIFMNGLVLAAAVQAIATAMGSIALMVFGGDLAES